ncbi:MAG: aminodeoxychorismate synthase component I [Planctomycetaceae bacterium]
MFPLIEEIASPPDVMHTLRQFAHLPCVLLFDSARSDTRLGRYSFLMADPVDFEEVQAAEFGEDPFASMRSVTANWSTENASAELPPFQGGYAGLLGYELGEAFEKLPRAKTDEFQMPALVAGLYDWVIAWDHEQSRCWIISQGFPETDKSARMQRARERMAMVRALLTLEPAEAKSVPKQTSVPESQFEIKVLEGLLSNFSKDAYVDAVRKVIDYIYAGDIFQANLSQRLLYPQEQSSIELYSRLRTRNAAPFAGYFQWDDWSVLSASPERFVRVENREVETRPIKGTRKRSPGPEADLFTRDELRESRKDRAENVMIVDLLRNDLSRVCEPGSIRVPQLCTVETYETVQHLVSEIRGRLRDGVDVWDLFAASFPGGSITGAPKIRSMEIIAELEPTVRGPYCGSLFYVSCSGHADSNILIRTFTCRNGWVQCPAGGGIVADSDPQSEYEETLHKAEGMLRALRD